MKLTFKLTLAFLLVSLIAIGLAAIFIWGATSFEFTRYLQDQRENEFATVARQFYEQNQTWRGVDRALQQQGLIPPPPQPGGQSPLTPPFALLDGERVVLIPSGHYLLGQKVPSRVSEQEIRVEIDGKLVGTVITAGQPLIKNPADQLYINRINQALLIAAFGGMLLALILGIWLARTLTRPVNELTTATRALASGKLEQQVPVRSQDELGDLAASFNQMSADLARANLLRRQMTADIAHDLRNPLTVIGGYLESLKDGKLKPTPERFETMYAEIQHLQRLVDDLRTLSLADSGELVIYRQLLAPGELLERVAAAYHHQAEQQKITILVDMEPGLPEINVDSARMEQVLGNLISNALRYTPDTGTIRLVGKQETGGVILIVQDNGSGIPPQALPHIFERSYRGDASRQGNESGLGLSITKSIVELHGGKIVAMSDGPGTGAQFLIFLPG